ncbi:group II intron reverse transcriptase/maturase [Clostridium tyrobutyricum]|uniref:group II intron reverse transcriptase/maturase n=1 Tax=Clostridium tyrobutyricum TaxID=1519 RepID=UPI001C3848F0|nr:group II intron reverse transcriptase/maturase [Clostridium tyrobutyricum]MBV4417393.1 group II intron reverse transcriptase/maturase [Clostridium tyrobutyricum]
MNELRFNCTKSENHSNYSYEKGWSSIDWAIAEEYVNRLQLRIVKAVKKGNWNLVKRLQYLITNSFYAKVLAVRKVTGNKGGKTSGVDKILWTSDKQKYLAVKDLEIKGYKPMPTRRINIKKDNGNLRPLSIPTMKDRAMQTLFLYGLQPIAETTGDKHSFGFRKYRSCADAMEQLFTILSMKKSGQWILEGDIKGCFDNVNHTWMINNINMDKTMIQKFLKAGFVYRKQLFPTNKGTIQGGTISPTFANLTLDGMEHEIAKSYFLTKKGKISYHSRNNPNQIHIVRYADDFVVTANNKEVLKSIKDILKTFLADRGLELSNEKTSITHINKGFDFLGWNYKKYNEKLIIQPSVKSIKKVVKKLSEIIHKNKTSKQEHLIYKLNQVINGWCNYHQKVCSKQIFNKLNYNIFNMFWRWAKRRHPNKSARWIKNRYWRRKGTRDWIFSNGKATLIRPTDIPIVRHERLKLDMNPYINKQYFLTKQERRKAKRRKAYKETVAFKSRLTRMNDLSVKNA